MLSGLWSNVKMVQALTILSALQLFSEGLPGAEGSGEPYGISRGVVEGAARAGSALNPKTHDDGEIRAGVPVPALSQVSPTAAPSSSNGLLNRPINNRHGEAQRPDMPGCSVGLFGKGVIRFERIPNWHLARPNTDMLRRSEAPADVLFMCQDLCLKNSTGHNQRQFCNSVDFVPGERISHMTFTESKCFLSTPNETPGQLPQYRPAPNQYHYREVCYGGEGMDQPTAATDCPERLYVMERSLNMRFMPKGARQVHANTLEMCQQMCLSQAVEDPLMTTSICRAGTFDYQNSRCYLSTFTRRTHPEEMLEDPNFSYFENTCLDVERRCPQNKLIWTMEVKKELKGPFDSLLYQNVSLKECQALCLKNSNIFCRSIEYDERAKMCTLSDEDSVSQPSGIQDALSDQNLYLELRCIYRDSEESGQSVRQGAENTRERQPLSDRDLRDVYTAFQLIRNRVLELSPGFRETGREGRAVSLAECLDQCLEEAMFPCRSAIYSESRRLCRLSEYDRINGKLAYDDDFDYYENIMGGSTQSDSSFTRFKGDSFEDSSGRFPSFGGTRFLDDRFSQSGNRFDANRFESNKGGGLSRFHAQDSQNDRFSGAFNRFHESKFDRTGTRFSDSDFYQGNRDIAGTFGSRVSNEGFSDDRFDNDRRLSGNKGFSSDRRFLDDRWGSSDDRKFSSERRFSDERRFSGDRRFVDDRRFGSGGTFSGDRRFDTTRFQSGGDTKRFQTGGSFFSSGADVASLRPNSGGVNTQLPNRNRFGSGGFSSFGLGSSSSFGSSSSGFGFGGGGNSIDHSGFGPASADGTRHEGFKQPGGFPVERLPDRDDYRINRRPPPGIPNRGGETRVRRPGYRPSYDGRHRSWDSNTDLRSPPSHDFDRENDFYRDRGPPAPAPRPGLDLDYGYGSNYRPGHGNKETHSFDPIGLKKRLRYHYIRSSYVVRSVNECADLCLMETSFTCRSFNYRYAGRDREKNCELSDMDLSQLDLSDRSHFEFNSQYDYYERTRRRSDRDVSQQCNPDGSMEFMLRTEESFRGRIYTFGYYDRCFTRGGGSSVNVLKISPPRSFPECGTVRYGDTTTNIVVVQFADGVMTSRDKRYNLTCTTIGPGDSVVTSAYIGAGLGAPIPIEYLPEESRLDSQVRLQILYQGRPTTTVAVGDPLTFRVESMTGRELVSDIFVTNVAVRDVLTGRSIELIDRRGCPVREEIFPALGRARSGNGVETRFSGFKMPETNMLYFEAKVRACKRQCEPARCSGGRGRTEQYSMGKKRRRRSTNDEDEGSDQYDEYDFNVDQDEHGVASTTENPGDAPFHVPSIPPTGADEGEDQEADNEWLQDRDEPLQDDNDEPLPELGDEEAKLNEVIKVYMYENEAEEHRIEEAAALTRKDVCVALSEYYSLLAALLVTGLLLLASLFVMGLCFRKQKKLQTKNAIADESNPCPPHRRAVFPGSHARTVNQPARYFPSSEDKSRPTFDLEGRSGGGNRFPDPSEPIYTDPALFERSPQSEVSSSSAKL